MFEQLGDQWWNCVLVSGWLCHIRKVYCTRLISTGSWLISLPQSLDNSGFSWVIIPLFHDRILPILHCSTLDIICALWPLILVLCLTFWCWGALEKTLLLVADMCFVELCVPEALCGANSPREALCGANSTWDGLEYSALPCSTVRDVRLLSPVLAREDWWRNTLTAVTNARTRVPASRVSLLDQYPMIILHGTVGYMRWG